jgi:hypothetical protein
VGPAEGQGVKKELSLRFALVAVVKDKFECNRVFFPYNKLALPVEELEKK